MQEEWRELLDDLDPKDPRVASLQPSAEQLEQRSYSPDVPQVRFLLVCCYLALAVARGA